MPWQCMLSAEPGVLWLQVYLQIMICYELRGIIWMITPMAFLSAEMANFSWQLSLAFSLCLCGSLAKW